MVPMTESKRRGSPAAWRHYDILMDIRELRREAGR